MVAVSSSLHGGLFLMDKTSSKPVGRDIGGLRVHVIGAERQAAKKHVFTLMASSYTFPRA